ncbi:hypothetical protein AB0M95_37535 [Sphaerisporangium sp. NPDC051017]|uniref:hypothetical protein n=1 Tax=unclassified Sphaerisporangium TaxID=2630420 RepID=UPI0033F95D14
MDLLATALDGFAVLAQNITDLADGTLRAYTVNGWPSPSFSPVIHLASHTPGHREFATARAFWDQQWADATPTACLLVPVTTMPAPVELPSGWHADEHPLHVIVEESGPVEVTPDDASTLCVTPLGDSEAEEKFLHLVTACFPDTCTAPEKVLTQLQEADAHTELITLHRGTPGEPAAASALTVKNQTAFQTWGAVPEPYRGLRLSRVLQQAALRRAYELGAAASVTVTRNPRVIGTHRPRLDLRIYRNTPSGEYR